MFPFFVNPSVFLFFPSSFLCDNPNVFLDSLSVLVQYFGKVVVEVVEEVEVVEVMELS